MLCIEYVCGDTMWVLGHGIEGYKQELELSLCPGCGEGIRMTTTGPTVEAIKEARAYRDHESTS